MVLMVGARALVMVWITLATRMVYLGKSKQRVMLRVDLIVRTCTHREVLLVQYISVPRAKLQW
jgi:hypothetical protein